MVIQETKLVLGNAQCHLVITGNAAAPLASFSHMHPNFELFYVWEGALEITVGETVYRIGPGEAALIAPACYHQTASQPDTEKFNIYFSVEPLFRRRSGEDVYAALAQVLSDFSVAVISPARALGTIMAALREIPQGDCLCREERLQAALTQLLLAIYDERTLHLPEPKNAAAQTGGDTLYRYEIDVLLAQNYAGDLDLTFLSEHFHLSPKRISLLVKSLYGKTFRQLKTEMRIQVAKQLLKESDLTVAEIGKRVGYDTTRGFLAAFTDLTGRTPSTYREESRKHAAEKEES